MIEKFDIAGYCRISVDEELDRDNTSIENQKAIISDFVKQKFPGSTLTFFEDRDKSGYTFDQRPGYQAMRWELMAHQKAILIINEHCDLLNRQIYDQDNKGWKAVPNAIKGVLVPDDDQFTLELALLSTLDGTPSCHIYLLPQEEAGEFFALRTGQYGFCL